MAAWRSGMGGLVCLLVACGSGTGAGSISGGRGNSPEAGSEDAGGVADAGNPTGGGPGTDAGPGGTPMDGGTGGNDAGSTGSGDGGGDAGPVGPSDGGSEGPTACATPAPADVCQRLNPPLPAPVVHQETEVFSDVGKGVFCGEGAYPASGTGVLLHPMQPEGLPPRFDFVDRTGAEIGSFDEFSIATIRFEVIPQMTGFGIFAPYIGGIGRYPVALVDDHGVRRGGTGGLAVAKLPAGGVGVFSFLEEAPGCNQDTRLFVQRFDESGAPALSDPTELGCYFQVPIFAMAGNGAGDVLVLVGPYTGTSTGWEGYWLDRDLRVLQKFTTPELAAAPNDLGTAIAALLDGSFVIRFGGQWTYRIQPGATTLEQAPCFLTQRPDTDLQVTGDGTAYALVRGYAASCDEAVEVFTSAGETCGPVGPLEGAGGKCEVALGRDGTISGSAEAVDAGAGQPRSCVLRFWPSALGETDF